MALMLAGCAGCADEDLVLTPVPELRTDVAASVARWTEACPEARVSVGVGGVPVEIATDLEGTGHDGATTVLDDGRATRIRVLRIDRIGRILDHEIGHAMGLLDGDSPIMAARGIPGEIVPADCAALARRRR